MQRHHCSPRADWRSKVEELGLTYHSHAEGPYWDESACYELTAAEVDTLEAAANTLHYLCIDAAEAVIERGWWARLGIPTPPFPASCARGNAMTSAYTGVSTFPSTANIRPAPSSTTLTHPPRSSRRR